MEVDVYWAIMDETETLLTCDDGTPRLYNTEKEAQDDIWDGEGHPVKVKLVKMERRDERED